MSPLSDEYIRSLEPETLRYDVTIFDDFVISVLPNGIKTWAFLYDYEGRKRRKTLGVYPDMTYEQAEDALDNVRGMIAKLGDDIKDSPVDEDTLTVEPPESAVAPPVIEAAAPRPEQQRPAVLAPRRRYRHHRATSSGVPRGWIKPFALGLAAVIAIGAAVVVIPRLNLFDSDSNASKPAPLPSATPERAAPKPIILDDKQPADESKDADKIEPEPTVSAPTATPQRGAPKPIILDDNPLADELKAASTPEPEAAEPAAQLDEPVSETAAPVTLPNPLVAEPAPQPVALEPIPTPPEQIALAPARDPPQEIADAAPEPATLDTTDTSTIAPAAAAPTNPTPIETVATAANGDVTRAIVTSNVRDLEPVDNLGEDISLNNAGFQTVFYFTELRNFSAGQIVHRWTYNGRVIADVPLRVDGGWRWRTYSSKDLLPGMTGDWSVAVIDADGRTLGERQFRFDR